MEPRAIEETWTLAHAGRGRQGLPRADGLDAIGRQDRGQEPREPGFGSVVSRITPPASSLYSGTKGALDAITQVLSKELGARQIRVNAVNPGIIATEGTASAGILGSEFETQAVAGTPLGRVGQPQDIAQVVAFLASDAAGWVTGELINVGGGVH